MIQTGETDVLGEKPAQYTQSTINSTGLGLESNPGKEIPQPHKRGH
jgi:hypothetical protein